MNKDFSPELEQAYLQFNGSSSLYAALLILAAIIKSSFGDYLDETTVFSISFYAALIIIAIGFIRKMVQSMKFNKFYLSKNACLGKYDDEFLNQVSLIAYRIVFVCSMLLLIPGYLGAFDYFSLTTTDVSGLILAVSFAVYGISVLVQLRDHDE